MDSKTAFDDVNYGLIVKQDGSVSANRLVLEGNKAVGYMTVDLPPLKNGEKYKLIKRQDGKMQVETVYFEEQFELLKKFNLPQSALERNEVQVREGGALVLVKREKPISIFPDTDGNLSASHTQDSYSEFALKDERRGKYNDGALLGDAQYCADLATGEVAAFAEGF